jgi:nitrate reductase gamma subunit
MGNEQEKPANPRGRRKKITGIVLFWVGIAAILIFFLIAVSIGKEWYGSVLSYVLFASACGIIAGFLFVIIGTTLYSVGRSQAKKQKNQNIPHLEDR